MSICGSKLRDPHGGNVMNICIAANDMLCMFQILLKVKMCW